VECRAEEVLQLMSSCEVTAQQRHDELLSTLMAAEKAEHELHKNIELLKNIRYRIFSLCVLSADMSLMKNIHDQLVVLQHCATVQYSPVLFLLLVFVLFCLPVLIHF